MEDEIKKEGGRKEDDVLHRNDNVFSSSFCTPPSVQVSHGRPPSNKRQPGFTSKRHPLQPLLQPGAGQAHADEDIVERSDRIRLK
jgi:hypothetical protein